MRLETTLSDIPARDSPADAPAAGLVDEGDHPGDNDQGDKEIKRLRDPRSRVAAMPVLRSARGVARIVRIHHD